MIVSLLFAFAQFRMILLILGAAYRNSIDAALGVVQGQPHWRVFQSRVLSPWIIKGLSILTGGFPLAHIFFVIAMTALAGWLMLSLTDRCFGRRAAWGAFFLFHLLFCLLLAPPWLYAWDHASIILFTLFTYFVLTGKDWRWFAVLFSVAIFNRESGLYIALWMIADPLVKAVLDRARPQWAMLVAGLVCFGSGLVLLNMLRDLLLVKEVGPALFNMPEMAGRNFQNNFVMNVNFIKNFFENINFYFNMLIPCLMICILCLSFILSVRDFRRYFSLALVQVASVVSILVFGVISETRVLLESIPFLAMGIWVLFPEAEKGTSRTNRRRPFPLVKSAGFTDSADSMDRTVS
ncbi:hypothetical protein CWS72_08145 [Telmatospirillum siberiense]|uniref:Glycosyltransferase RgtA/B/C/D-like domain-containing protein n=1 Tax=Telmatospirillum siberiense TaxID=382514 RepID=A0A2N3PXN5_9PROT|nr:hypothetical protein CWS72_08145 [Telmatospirillum siberiense]